MPSRNTVKTYVSDGIYHIYNRGVEKRPIFNSAHDYYKFTNYFRAYLGTTKVLDSSGRAYPKINDHAQLLAYCLMPNHFHLLVCQYCEDGIAIFSRHVMTAYAMYFNKRYDRVGPLFQGRYKAVLITSDEQLIQIYDYIHRNPASGQLELLAYPYSSLSYYQEGLLPDWLTAAPLPEPYISSLQGLSLQI